MAPRRKYRQSGNTIMELAIVLPVLSTLFFGSTALGIMLGRYVQVVQVARDVAHMYSDGVDFTTTRPRNIVTQKLASGIGITDTAGNGVVILSKVTTVYPTDCTANGYTSGQCANQNQVVFINRIYIGDKTLRASAFGTPNAAILDSRGNISSSVYMQNTDSTVRAAGFEAAYDDAVQRATGSAPAIPAMAQGDIIDVVETYFKYPDIGFLGWTTGGAYTRYMFR
jgi:TadE-like protein